MQLSAFIKIKIMTVGLLILLLAQVSAEASDTSENRAFAHKSAVKFTGVLLDRRSIPENQMESIAKSMERYHRFVKNPTIGAMDSVFFSPDGSTSRMKKRFNRNSATFAPGARFESVEVIFPIVQWGRYYITYVEGWANTGENSRWVEAFACESQCYVSDFFRGSGDNGLGMAIAQDLIEFGATKSGDNYKKGGVDTNPEICVYPSVGERKAAVCVMPEIIALDNDTLSDRGKRIGALNAIESVQSHSGDLEGRLDHAAKWFEYDRSYGFPVFSGGAGKEYSKTEVVPKGLAMAWLQASTLEPLALMDNGRFIYIFYRYPHDTQFIQGVQWIPWDREKKQFRIDVAKEDRVVWEMLRTPEFMQRIRAELGRRNDSVKVE